MAMAKTNDPLAQALYTDIKTWLPGDILTKVDRASMANSLEVRAPFLDHKFMEWAATLPSGLKLHRGTGKYILKRALEPLLPREILYRPKQGFSMPLSQWFRGRFEQELRSAIASPTLQDTGYFIGAHWNGWSTIMSAAGRITRRSFGWCSCLRFFLSTLLRSGEAPLISPVKAAAKGVGAILLAVFASQALAKEAIWCH